MITDFLDSHSRHSTDADYLFSDNKLANADQLYGFSVECGIKALMQIFGMPFDTVKQIPSNHDDRVHVDKIWQRYDTYRSGHISGTHYSLSSNNPFNDWNASQRYSNSSHFDINRVTLHKNAASQVKSLIQKAKLDGLL